MAGKTELENCIVASNELIQVLIRDCDDAKERVSSSVLWERGGRAQVKNLNRYHKEQRANANVNYYASKRQKEYIAESKAFFHSKGY